MDSGWIVGIGGVVTAIISGAVVVLNTLHKNGQENRAATVAENNAVIAFLREEIKRLEASITAQQNSIDSLRQAHTDCREESIDMRNYIVRLFDYACRIYAAQRTGRIIDEPPPAQPPPRTANGKAADFLARTVAQDRMCQDTLMPPPPPPEEGHHEDTTP